MGPTEDDAWRSLIAGAAPQHGPEGPLTFAGAGLALLARAGVAARSAFVLCRTLRRLFALGHLALRQLLALRKLLALDTFLGLRLDFARRQADTRQHGLLGIVEVRDALHRPEVGESKSVADRHAADIEVDVLRDLHGQGLDVDLALHLREHAALLHAHRLADELHGHARLDRLVEAHFLQVDVRDVAADRILLVVLENRGVRGVLAFDDDVED